MPDTSPPIVEAYAPDRAYRPTHPNPRALGLAVLLPMPLPNLNMEEPEARGP